MQRSSQKIRTTLHTEFCSGEGEILGCALGNANLVCQSLVIRKLIQEDTSVRVVPESSPLLEFISPEKRKNLHPARVVCPACWEASEYGEDSSSSSSPSSTAATTLGETGTSVVVHVQAERPTTELSWAPRADHVAVGGCRRCAIATDSISAVLREKGPIR